MVFTPVRHYRRLLLLAGVLTLASQGLAAETCPAPAEEPHPLDWVPISQLSDAQRDTLPRGCCGAYLAPERSDPDAVLEPELAPVRASARRVEGHQETQLTLEGDARLTQGNRSARAEWVQMNQSSGQLELGGDIAIREPGLLLRAEQAHLNIDSGAARLDDAQFVLYETRVRGGAQRLERIGDRLVRTEDGYFTTCEPDDNFWRIHAAEITLDGDRQFGTAKHARLLIKDIPILYTPYVRFPVGEERLTGFLMPSLSLGTQSRNGTQLTLPYYWNIAPNADMTLTPRHMTERGTLWEGEARHLSRHFASEFSGGFLANDRGGRRPRLDREIEEGLIAEQEARPLRGEDRWMYQFRQSGGESQRWSSHIDFTELSDNDYIRDLGGASLEERRRAQIRNQGELSYRSDHWRTAISAEEVRFLAQSQRPYRELPRVTADGQYRWRHWLLNLNNELVSFGLNRHFDNPTQRALLPTGERLRTDYSLVWDFDADWGFIKPGAGYRTLNYQLDADKLAVGAEDSPSLSAAMATLDTGLNFDRHTPAGWLQTLEPRLLYFYSERADHSDLFAAPQNNRPVNFDTTELNFTYDQVFRTTRFAGGDRLDDANQLAAGLTSRLISPVTGVEHLRFSVGQIFYFDDRQVGLTDPTTVDDDDSHLYPRSELASHLSGQLGRNLRFVGNITYDPHRDTVSRGNLRLHYLDDRYRIFNLAYNFTRQPEVPHPLFPDQTVGRSLNQVDTSIVWPVANGWSLIARSNYDFTHQRELDSFAGLEYADCCYRLRVIARRWLDFDFSPDFIDTASEDDYDEGLFLELELRGLGSIADRIGDFLSREIIGFKSRQQNLR